jgi:hypothetical protein
MAAPVTAEAEVAPQTLSATVTPPVPAPSTLAVGVGYPDLRVRYDFARSWAVEAKGSWAEGLQAYGARLNDGFAHAGPLTLLAGAEAGWLKFDGIQTISGTGAYEQAYVGIELPFAQRWKLELDGGPLWAQLSSEGQSASGVDLVVDAALYLYVW